MPEGHVLHRLAKLHHERFAGDAVGVTSPQGRFATGAAQIDGRILTGTEAYGKHLFHHYESGLTVHIHLGLYGTFSEPTSSPGEPVGQVRMRMSSPARADTPAYVTDLRGPAKCELIDKLATRALTARLGPDPLRRDADPDLAWQRIHISDRPIAALLLDQNIIAGIGNVYRAETLYRQRISPHRPGRDLTKHEWDSLWQDLVTLLRHGVEHGKIIVVHPEHDHGHPAYAKNKPRTYVYRRTHSPCRTCTTPITHTKLNNRNLYWCPTCQPT